MIVIIRYKDEVQDLKDFAKKNKIKYREIAKGVGCSSAEVGMWFNKSRSFPNKWKLKIEKFMYQEHKFFDKKDFLIYKDDKRSSKYYKP